MNMCLSQTMWATVEGRYSLVHNIYMDHSATAPLSEAALNAMLPFMREQFGNPSAVYSYGQTAK